MTRTQQVGGICSMELNFCFHPWRLHMCTLEPSLTCSLQVPSIRSHYQNSTFMLPKRFTLSFDLTCNMTRRIASGIDGIYPSCSVKEVLHFWSNIHVTPRDGNGLSKSLHFSHHLQHHKVILTLDPPSGSYA